MADSKNQHSRPSDVVPNTWLGRWTRFGERCKYVIIVILVSDYLSCFQSPVCASIAAEVVNDPTVWLPQAELDGVSTFSSNKRSASTLIIESPHIFVSKSSPSILQ